MHEEKLNNKHHRIKLSKKYINYHALYGTWQTDDI